MEQDEKIWYLVACLTCEPFISMPFLSEKERSDWMAAHKVTGHDRWLIWYERDGHPVDFLSLGTVRVLADG